MNYFKPLLVTLLASTSILSFSAKAAENAICAPVLEKKCSGASCMDHNIVIDGLYNKCVFSMRDMETIKEGLDLTQTNFNSDVGFMVSFSNIISRALANQKVNDKFDKVKGDFLLMKKQYSQYSETKRKNFLSSLDFLDVNKDKDLKESILKEDSVNQLKIKRSVAQLDFMLKSEVELTKYRQTHQKFIPNIYYEKDIDKFKDKNFTKYECTVLQLNFDESELSEFKKSLNYKCE